jgi:copper(I)-binding protein
MKLRANNDLLIVDEAYWSRVFLDVWIAPCIRVSQRVRLAAGALVLTVLAGVTGLSTASAQTVDVQDAWVRPTVAGQLGTGAFMTLTAKAGTRLVGVSTPVAGIAEVHEMKLEGDVMKMRAVAGLDLPAGKAVALTPGGYHLMLMDLKAPLLKDTTVDLTMQFQDAKGVATQQVVKLAVGRAPVGAAAPVPGGHAGHGGHGAHSPAMK